MKYELIDIFEINDDFSGDNVCNVDKRIRNIENVEERKESLFHYHNVIRELFELDNKIIYIDKESEIFTDKEDSTKTLIFTFNKEPNGELFNVVFKNGEEPYATELGDE